MSKKILVIDDEETIRITFQDFLEEEGYQVTLATSFEEATTIISNTVFEIILSDINLGERRGIDLLQEPSIHELEIPLILVTGYPSLDTATEALRLGAFDYISKPVRKNELLKLVAKAIEFKVLQEENNRNKANLISIFQSVQEGILTVDKEFKITEINPAFQTICGLSKETWIGKSAQGQKVR